MSKKIYVGNLPFSTSEDSLRNLFSQHGEVHSASIITDRDNGRPRGFAFVEMDPSGADAAIEALDQQEFEGRKLTVNVAKPREPRRQERW